MPPGDTGDLYLEIEWDTNGKDAAAVFAIVDTRYGKDLMLKAAEIVDGKAHIQTGEERRHALDVCQRQGSGTGHAFRLCCTHQVGWSRYYLRG